MPRFVRPNVGVGADNIFEEIGQRFFEDEEARKRREVLEDAARAQQFQQQGLPSAQAEARVQQERQFTPDPLRWIQERAEDTRRNPIIGGLRSLGAIPEAAGTAARYATGVALAPVQAGAQAYGWNAQGATNDIASGTQYLPGADLPIMGGLIRGAGTLGGIGASALGTAGRTGADLLTGNVPQQRGDLAGQRIWDMSPTPAPTWENPFDPREALQRSRALAGPGELAPELAAGNVPFGLMGRGLSALGGRAAGGLAPDVGILDSVHGNPFAEFFAPGRGALGATIPPAVGAVAGAISPVIPGKPQDEETAIMDRLMGAGEGFLLGGLLGMGASSLERRLVSVAGKDWRPDVMSAAVRDTGGSARMADEIVPGLMEANARQQGLEGRALTPGGPVQHALDNIVSALYDNLRPVGTAMAWADQALADKYRMMRASGLPAPDLQPGESAIGPAGNFFKAIANTRGVKQRVDQLVATATDSIAANGGGIYKNERDSFNAYGTLRTMIAASGNEEQNFMGPYRTLYKDWLKRLDGDKDQAAQMVRAQLIDDSNEYLRALPAAFPGTGDVVRRFEATATGLSELNNLALGELETAGILRVGTAALLKDRYGDQYGHIVEASTQFTNAAASGKKGSTDYLARQRAIGEFHQANEMPAYTIQDQLQHVRNAIALAEHNKASKLMADAMYAVGDEDATGKFLGVPGFMEPNLKHPEAVPGPATYERRMIGADGQPVIGPDGKPVMITVQRPDADNFRMVYDTHVPKDMGIVPYYVDGVHNEMLVEKSIAEALNGANVETHNLITKLASSQARFFAKGVTSASPFFWAMHGLRQTQEFVEKMPRGEMGRAMQAYWHGLYGTIADGLAEFGELHPNHPIIQDLPNRMAGATARTMGQQAWRDLNSEARAAGVGASTLPFSLHSPQSAEQALGLRTQPGIRAHLNVPAWLRKPVDLYMDFNQMMTGLFDEIPRIASYDVVMQKAQREAKQINWQTLDNAGNLAPMSAGRLNEIDSWGARSIAQAAKEEAQSEALSAARTWTNDYGRFGYAGQVLNSFLPLSNARKEGFITSISGAIEDPQRFATRMTMYMGLPAITAYAANRLAYGDAYDDLTVSDRETYFHIPYGWWQDEAGRDHPLTIKIIKSPFVQAMTAPLEQLLDAQYHLAKDGEYLAENQRTSRPDQRMWLTSLLRLTPLEGQPDMAADVHHLAMSAASMQPLVSMAVEMASNEDHFTGRDIIPPEKRLIPPQYQYGVGTSMTAKLAGKFLHQSPGVIDQFAADMFGTAGRSAMHIPDLITGILQKHGLVEPGDPFAPQTAADLPNLAGLPPEVVNRYLDQMQHEDLRPWQGQFLPRFFGTTYSGRSIQARAKQLGPEEHERWESTLEYDRHRREITVKYSGLRAELETKAPDITNAAYRDKLWQLTMQEKGARTELADTYAGRAWTSPAERQAAINAMPGTSVDGFQKSLAQLPQGTDVAALAGQWEAIGQQGNAPTVASMRNRWLQQTSQQLHVPASTILDYLGSYHLGNELVGLPVPVEDVERLRTEHAAPMDPKDPTKQLDPFTTPADKFRTAQRAVIANYASMWGVPESNLLERLNARYHLPGETVGPVQAQQQLAAAMETRFHDPKEYPRYSSPAGQAVGTPDDWEIWDRQLDDARNKYGDHRNRWPGGIRILDDARRYGNAHRYLDMLRHTTDGTEAEREAGFANLVAWTRFYGTGRNATLTEWNQFTSGDQAKYKANISPQTAIAWDSIHRAYQLLPPGPEKNRYRPMAERIHRLANPRWLALLDEHGEAARDLAQSSSLASAGSTSP